MSDLPHAVLAHNEELFRVLYSEHLAGIYGLAKRLCGPIMAADVAQEVFLQLWRQPDRFDPSRGSLHALLLTMAHHKSVDHIRSENSRHLREHPNLTDEGMSTDLDERLLKFEQSDRITAAVNELPPKVREAIVTAFYGQCTYKEAAVVLGQPEGTIKSRIREGLAQLRVALQDAA